VVSLRRAMVVTSAEQASQVTAAPSSGAGHAHCAVEEEGSSASDACRARIWARGEKRAQEREKSRRPVCPLLCRHCLHSQLQWQRHELWRRRQGHCGGSSGGVFGERWRRRHFTLDRDSR
jgi:hypothetical protein